ncbi:MAG: Penicillin-binding protein dacF [Parcubacteria group bacterium GW2011_GWC1_42_11]|uniref:Penicillin-binding protein dacF n=1 Tax=Candidatus Nomurabacteria bacterium GW2011_GWC2_42_20 TaxID=1618756 RepID=A0A0G0ZE77_9BACT|nr:MAG: Penicillin-binding protein dacF [Parcubacteria group bacterium GW2011_GWC1_42_11]KKS47025.1 MAG: Penicillin-binding protein dacF [Candidatus Nomurabacteria bacterium GW2011_GWC2_42_20]KKS59230.1 MAG: Penicillin-binding protein dacF [Candidatus Nomurabacteria bacterium GW2011_GWA2_42_41]KKT09165.1 MAG: Penicillin-binding protein dacF [Candidatus Nomurabacteria bacterium GW2011_GWB1_43_20]TAN35494.1 MAG: D-alanyl-D-alanine carboxypeptidase [Patescibacteria group bacterium]HBH71280.1 hypo
MDTKKNRAKIVAKRYRALAIVLGGTAGIALLIQGLLSFALGAEAQTRSEGIEEIRSVKTTNPFETISLEAHAAYVIELKTGTVLYAKNENQRLPLASITKLMTTLIARENLSKDLVATITKDDLSVMGDSGLHPGERWSLGDILNVMLLVSSNDAAHAVSGLLGQGDDTDAKRAVFIQKMNEKAGLLNLEQMEFFNESGLDVSDSQNGGYGSARNVAILFAELWRKYPETVEITAHKDARIYSQDNIAHILPNTNEIVGSIPGLIASKTGFTDMSGGNLTVIFDRGIGDPVLIVVLGSGYKGRFDDVQKLVYASREVGSF